MAAESGRVVIEEQEELPASGAVTHVHHTHTRSQSHIQFQPLTHTNQWQAARTLAHTRSHSHTHFNTQSQKYSCRLTHSLSAMAKGERGAQGPAGKLIKPTEPLFPKTPQQVRSPVCVASLVVAITCNCRSPKHTDPSWDVSSGVFAAQLGRE